MSQKKPVWVSTAAHLHLKAYCKAAGRTQLQVVSELIETQLNLDNPEQVDSKKAEPRPGERHFGGVWVV